MSYTYTQEMADSEADTTFVPSYARKTVKTKKIKTWMVLAPIAGVALIGGAAALLINSSGEVQPLSEPAVAPAALAQPTPISSTPAEPMMTAPAPQAEAAPAGRAETPAPVRRVAATPVRRAAPAPAATQTAPAEPAGPRAYQDTAPAVSPAASTAAPSTSTAPAPVPAPAIVVSPLS